MTSQGGLPVAFVKAAVRFNVSESDFLLLGTHGIATFEALAYRIIKADDMEVFMREEIAPKAAYKQPDGVVVTFDRTPAIQWTTFKMSEDCAALRKLWALSREICRAEVELLASGDTEKSKVKVDISLAITMEKDAVKAGMPEPHTDRERPSLYTLSKAARALVPPGASYEYVGWEYFLSLEEEGRLVRAGKLLKAQPELVMGRDHKLTIATKDDDEIHVEEVDTMESFRMHMEIRARAMAMLKVANYEVYRALTDRYVAKLKSQVPQGMRQPTLNEVRRFDRNIHEDALRWLARSVGSLDKAITHYLKDYALPVWRLLDPVIDSLPDQGVEKTGSSSQGAGTKRKHVEPTDDDKPDKKTTDSDPKQAVTSKGPKCLVCGKKHTPLCPLPPGFRKKQREENRKKKVEAKAKASANAGAEGSDKKSR